MKRLAILGLLLFTAQTPAELTPGEIVAAAAGAGCWVQAVQRQEGGVWVAHYAPNCTSAQIAAGNAALAAFDSEGWLVKRNAKGSAK